MPGQISESQTNHPTRSPFRTVLAVAVLLGITALTWPHHARAGQAQAELKCSSMNRRGGIVRLEGEIPGDLDTFHLAIRVGKAELIINSDTSADQSEAPSGEETKARATVADQIYVIKDFKAGVFTMVIDRHGVTGLRLYALPATVREVGRRSEEKITFDAVLLESLSPMGDQMLENVKMRCSYRYSI